MSLLLESDYLRLKESGLEFDEDIEHRYFIFCGVALPENMYNVFHCDVLVVIPPNYPQAGNDMFWTNPLPKLADGRPIPAVLTPGGGDNRRWQGREFCRWSRHWNPSSAGRWRPGVDDVLSIHRRIDWALKNPNCT